MIGASDELEKLNRMFMDLDTDKKGVISKGEMRKGLNKMLGSVKTREFDEIMN